MGIIKNITKDIEKPLAMTYHCLFSWDLVSAPQMAPSSLGSPWAGTLSPFCLGGTRNTIWAGINNPSSQRPQ